jgi:hypothetical protein
MTRYTPLDLEEAAADFDESGASANLVIVGERIVAITVDDKYYIAADPDEKGALRVYVSDP